MVSEEDWDLVNAYSDGELGPRDQSAFEERLRNEPELAAALTCVRNVSRSLSALRPQVNQSQSSKTKSAPLSTWIAAGAVAASILVTIFTILPQTKPMALDVHSTFLDQAFAVESDNLHMIAAKSAFPDLGAANLTFVAARETEIGTAAHYTGKRGCRLTFLTMSEPIGATVGAEIQIEQWNMENRYFAILATGMDAEKFSAIAAFLKEETRRSTESTTVLALREATQSAKRCI